MQGIIDCNISRQMMNHYCTTYFQSIYFQKLQNISVVYNQILTAGKEYKDKPISESWYNKLGMAIISAILGFSFVKHILYRRNTSQNITYAKQG